MCTVSWVHDDGGYQLFCNRDEKLSRRPAFSPRVGVQDGVRFLAPIDGNAGGTWIGVNEFGVTLALLNGTSRTPARTSRGRLTLDLLSATSQQEIVDRFLSRDLSPFAPFTLSVLQPGEPGTVLRWDGERAVELVEATVPLVSSSFDQTGAEVARRDEFARMVREFGQLDTAVLNAFHASHGCGPSAYSPCMHRADAETVSFTRVRTRNGEVTMDYTPSAPCKGLPPESVSLRCRTSS